VSWRDVAAAAEAWRTRFGSEASCTSDVARVGLRLNSPAAFCREYLAALAAGVTVAPLDPTAPEAELLWSVATLGLTHVLSDGGEVVEMLAGRRGGLDGPSGGCRGRASHPSLVPLARPADAAVAAHTAAVVSTRGSTGPPRLVPFSERQLLQSAETLMRHFNLSSTDRAYFPGALHRVDAQVAILAGLLSGGSFVGVSAFDLRTAWSEVEASGATWMNLAPAMVMGLAEAPVPSESILSRVRFVRVAGAPLRRGAHRDFWQRTGISLVETYTLTEAAGAVASNPLSLAGRRPGSVGWPVGVQVRIVDTLGCPLPIGKVGRIQVRGATVISHYLSYGLRRPPVPAVDDEGWLTTGDIGSESRQGYLFVAGREADLGAGNEVGVGIGREIGAAERSGQVPCGTPASPLRAAAFRP
jgi:acyl-CoA synthetase (AMP-forming)/AMP-acid ligase II